MLQRDKIQNQQFFRDMNKDISNIRECLWHIEDYLTIANHYLHEGKNILREIEEK